jgi:glycosyltransferase involved in cell wall biosynthesis
MKILFLSNAPFVEGFVLGSHHLSSQMKLQGHDVAHVSSPVTPFHVIKGGVGRGKLKGSFFRRKYGKWPIYDDIPMVPWPYGYSSKIDTINDNIVLRYLKKIGFEQVDLVLIDQPCFCGILTKIDAKKKIYRPTDIYKYMNGGLHSAYEKEILQVVDAIMSTSQNILDELSYSLPDKVINNGVDFALFDVEKCANASGCVYIGALDHRFDFEMMTLLAADNPDVLFDVYGPITILQVDTPNNLRYLGAVDYEVIPSILSGYRVALLPLSDDPANKGRSPMKLYEYLATGTPVYSKYLVGMSVERFDGLEFYGSDRLGAFREFYNNASIVDVSQLKAMALRQSWEGKARDLISWVDTVDTIPLGTIQH